MPVERDDLAREATRLLRRVGEGHRAALNLGARGLDGLASFRGDGARELFGTRADAVGDESERFGDAVARKLAHLRRGARRGRERLVHLGAGGDREAREQFGVVGRAHLARERRRAPLATDEKRSGLHDVRVVEAVLVS